jgi:multidrug efflux pump
MISALETVLRRPRTVLTLMVVIIIAGVAAYIGIPKEANPDIDVPVYYVSVIQQGVSPEDADRLIVRPLETHLRGIDGLKEISGFALEGRAAVLLEFDIGVDQDETLADIRDKVDRAKAEMPAEADEPVISETNFALQPTVTVTLSGSVPQRTLYRHAKLLQDEIEAIPTVREANLSGQDEEILEVLIDLVALESYDITQQELLESLQRNNQLVPAGFLDTGDGRFNVKVPGLLETVHDVYTLPIKQNGEGVVTLGDVAEIRRTFKDPTVQTRVNGEPAIAINVVKRIGTNIIENNQAVREVIDQYTADWPSAIKINFLLDQSSFIYEVLGSLQSAIITAIVLVMIVVLAALGLRSSFLVGLAIPTSFMTGFLILAGVGMTVNMMVMFGLVLTVGMLVDGAIVVVEYADRKMAEGMPPQEAYVRAAKLMFWPIVSSTATTLAAFLPMLLWPGVPGEFMSYLPIMVIIVLSASLLTALVFLPVTGALTARIAQWASRNSASIVSAAVAVAAAASAYVGASRFIAFSLHETLAGIGSMLAVPLAIAAGLGFYAMSMTLFGAIGRRWGRRRNSNDETAAQLSAEAELDVDRLRGFTGIYARSLKGLTGGLFGNLVTIAVVFGVVMSVFVGFANNPTGLEFFVEEEPDQTVVLVSGRGNLSSDQARALVGRVEHELLNISGIQNVVAVSYPNGGGSSGQVIGTVQDKPEDLIGELNVELMPYAERRTWAAIQEDIRRNTAQIAGIRVEPRKIEGGPPQGKDVSLRITGTDYDAVLETTALVREQIDSIEGLIDQEDSRPLPGIEWEFVVDREEAGRFNAGIGSVGSMIQLVTNGILLDKYRENDDDDEVEIRVRLPEEQRTLDSFMQLKLRTENGQVPISNFVTLKPKPKVGEITRVDGLYSMDVKAGADTAAGYDKTGRVKVVDDWLKTQTWPNGVRVGFSGNDDDQKETEAFLPKAGAAALFIMFIILVTQFNSFYQAFITLMTVVLAVAGVLIGMTVTGQKFSMIMTGTGVVALAGIVVNNAIVLIDTFNRMRSDGVDTLEASLKTAAQRLRPILLTTSTTIAGLIPMATQINLDFFNQAVTIGGITAVWWIQLSTAIIFGLAFSTILTLVLIPVLLVMPTNIGRLFKRTGESQTAERLKATLRRKRRAANDDYQGGANYPGLPEAAE